MTEPANTGELDFLDELIESPGWELLRARLELQLIRECDELERDSSEVESAKSRGAIRTLRLALGLPQMMRDELIKELRPGP